MYDAFNARDIPLLSPLFADDCETVDMGTGRRYRGFTGFMDWVKPFADALPDSTATPALLIADGDLVATEHVGRGTHTGPFRTAKTGDRAQRPDRGDPVRRVLPAA